MSEFPRHSAEASWTPRATFVVPCYNYAAYVAQAIESLLGQTEQSLEVIVIDDCSTDDSYRVIRRYGHLPQVTVIRHETNQGHIRTYNEGLRLARGEYVGLLSADDYAVTPDSVRLQVQTLDGHPSVGFVYGAHQLVDERGGVIREAVPTPHGYVKGGLDEFATLIMQNYVPSSGTLVRRQCHEDLGWYSEDLPHSGDWDLWLRLCTRYDVGYVAEPLYAYRIHAGNMSHARMDPAEITRELLLTVTRNQALLPPGANPGASTLMGQARRHALLMSTWLDLAYGRRARAWKGLAAAARLSPAIAASRAYWGCLVRTLWLTVAGYPAYRRTFRGIA